VNTVDLIALRIVPFWLQPDRTTGKGGSDAATTMTQRYRKSDGTSLTQFNTGALIIRQETVLALTECQPHRNDRSITIGTTAKSRAAVIEDIRQQGPPLLAVLFRKGAIDVGSWVCCTTDEVVLNGPDGPGEVASMEDIAQLRKLNGSMRAWRDAVSLYAQASGDQALAPKLYTAVDKLATTVKMTDMAILDVLHRLRAVQPLTYALAEQNEVRNG
jgi:hypothetical protein